MYVSSQQEITRLPLAWNRTAEALDVSVGAARHDWGFAQTWLFRELSEGGRDDA